MDHPLPAETEIIERRTGQRWTVLDGVPEGEGFVYSLHGPYSQKRSATNAQIDNEFRPDEDLPIGEG